MTTETQLQSSRRQLMMRDGFAFLILAATTGVLFAITLFLFRSFSVHRADLARRAADAGRQALTEHRPHDAIASLRSALSYAPNQRDYEFLLAQALGEDGRIDEAENYFLNLRESQPGDGFINLQLARLVGQQNKKQQAIDFYRASIFGDWKGEGDVHRRNVRLELAGYLTHQKDFQQAQSELLIAASNAHSVSDAALDVVLGDAFLACNDPSNAVRLYRKAMIDSPQDPIAYEKAGRIAYRQGDYAHARDWLQQYLGETGGNLASASNPEGDISTLLKNSNRLFSLDPDLATSRTDRIARELRNRGLARQRIDACVKQVTVTEKIPSGLQTLSSRWTASIKIATRDALLRDPANELRLNLLIDDTELLTAQICGQPTGDDILLTILAQRHNAQRNSDR